MAEWIGDSSVIRKVLATLAGRRLLDIENLEEQNGELRAMIDVARRKLVRYQDDHKLNRKDYIRTAQVAGVKVDRVLSFGGAADHSLLYA